VACANELIELVSAPAVVGSFGALLGPHSAAKEAGRMGMPDSFGSNRGHLGGLRAELAKANGAVALPRGL
jgi:hypothetical protein